MKRVIHIDSSQLDLELKKMEEWASLKSLKSIRSEIEKGSGEYFSSDDGLDWHLAKVSDKKYVIFLNKKADSSLDEKLKFLGEISTNIFHELNGPLNIMSSSLEILKLEMEDLKSPQVQELITPNLENFELGLLKMLNIIRGIQSFAQGRHDTKIVEIDKVIKNSIEFAKVFLKKDQVAIKFTSALASTIKAEMQDTLISQVLINLIKNSFDSVKSQPSFNRWIDVRLKEDDENFLIEVLDSGPGISLENQANLFNYGFSTKGAGIGHGIGLNFCKKVMKQHQGDIFYNSEYKNTCFALLLPKTKKVLR